MGRARRQCFDIQVAQPAREIGQGEDVQAPQGHFQQERIAVQYVTYLLSQHEELRLHALQAGTMMLLDPAADELYAGHTPGVRLVVAGEYGRIGEWAQGEGRSTQLWGSPSARLLG